TTEQFNEAEAQINTWRTYVEAHRDAVIAKFARLLSPAWLTMSKVKFKYVLIYGRESELAGRDDKRRLLSERFREDMQYLTYDSVWNRRRKSGSKFNVMRAEALRFT